MKNIFDNDGAAVGGFGVGLLVMVIVIAIFMPWTEPVYDKETCAAVVEERRGVEMYYDLREIKAHLVSVDAQLANLRERKRDNE